MSVEISLKQESIDELAESVSNQYQMMLPGFNKDDDEETKTVNALVGRETKGILSDIRDSMTNLVESFAQSVGIQKKTADELERDNDLADASSGESQSFASRFEAPEALVSVGKSLGKATGLLGLAMGLGYFADEIASVVQFLVDIVKRVGSFIKSAYNALTSGEFFKFYAILQDGLYNGIVAPILNLFKDILSWFAGILGFEAIEEWLDDFDFKFDLFGAIMTAMEDLGNWFGEVWDSLTGAVKEWWDKSKLNPKNWFTGDDEETTKNLKQATETSADVSANVGDPLTVSDAGITYREELDKAKTSKKKDYNKAFDIKNYEAFFNNYDPRNEVTGAQFWHSRKFKQQFNALLGDNVSPEIYSARWSSAVFNDDNAWSKKHSEFTEMKMNPDAYPKTYKSLDDFSVDRISKTQEFVVDKEPLPVELESAGADDPLSVSDVGVPRGNSKILKGLSDFFFGDDEEPKEEKSKVEPLKMNKNLQNLPAGSTINGKSISDMSKTNVITPITPVVANSDNRQNVVTTTNNTTNMPMNTGTSDDKVKEVFLSQ